MSYKKKRLHDIPFKAIFLDLKYRFGKEIARKTIKIIMKNVVYYDLLVVEE